MAAELTTPVDPLSRLPLPLAPAARYLPNDDGSVANWHHHFHPRLDPVLHGTLGGRALRSARIQLVPIEHHNYTETAYHYFFKGPEIPSDPAEQFGMSVLSCAGYIPDEAIDVSMGEPKIVPMSDWQMASLRKQADMSPIRPIDVRRFLRNSMPEDATPRQAGKELSSRRRRQAGMAYRNLRYGFDPMRKFFSEVVIDQDVSHKPDLVDEFVTTGGVKAGLSLLSEATNAAAQVTVWEGMSVAHVYGQARAAGRLNDRMPAAVEDVIASKLGTVDNKISLLPDFRQKLLGLPAELAS